MVLALHAGRRPLVDTGLELADGRPSVRLSGLRRTLTQSLKIGARAATAALEEANGEKLELQRQVADGAVERERLTAQVEELRDRVHNRDFLWQRVIEQTTTPHDRAAGMSE